MDVRIFTEPQQGVAYDSLVRLARAAEDLGYDGFFRSDHYLAMGGDGLPGPSDAWVCLAGLARETSRLRLGTLVTSATFRLPGVLAIQVAQVDQMSGGRVELGLGAGWFEAEHTAYGIPFPSVKERFDRFEEQLAVITGLWGTPVGDTFDHTGAHYTLKDSPGLPKPVQQPLPIIIGGTGKRRTPTLAARYAAEFNAGFAAPGSLAPVFANARQVVQAEGRDPDDLVWSVALPTVVGRDDAEVARRLDAIGRDGDEMRRECVCGTPEEVVERLQAYAAIGASRFYLQLLDVDDVDHAELIATRVMPHLG